MKMSPAEKKVFLSRFEHITNALLKETGLKTLSELGRWLRKNSEQSSIMYFIQVKNQFNNNYVISVLDRCIEEGYDLNVIFGDGPKMNGYDELIKKYKTLEKQVGELLAQNGILLNQNQEAAREYQKLSATSQEIQLRYLEFMNQKKA
jgi:hypothetical protein